MNKSSQNNTVYEIRIQGHLSSRRAELFGDMTVTVLEDGTTLVSGLLDQSALHGLLSQIRDLGLPLLSINRRDEEQPEAGASTQGRES